MKHAAAVAASLSLILAGCAGPDQLRVVDTRSETVEHQRLTPQSAAGEAATASYQLQASEGYRMPQLHTAPPPALGSREPRQQLAPTLVCLQLVVDADGRVERSLPLSDRPECMAGIASENAALLQAAQDAVARWEFAPAGVCHFPAGQKPRTTSDCEGAEHIEPVPVSLLYAFTFEIIKGKQYVNQKGDGGD